MKIREHNKDKLSDTSFFDSETTALTLSQTERKILQAMDAAFDSIGKNIKVVFYKALLEDDSMERGSLFSHPDDFIEFLRKFFGPGSILVERTISRSILSGMNLPGSSTNSIKTALEIVRRHPSIS